jgi:transcriptional regulator with XRE-family HTH domain
MEKRRLTPSEIGLYLCMHRDGFDWSKSAVADSIGISVDFLNKIISGNAAAALSDPDLVTLARAAGISEDYFIREHGFQNYEEYSNSEALKSP